MPIYVYIRFKESDSRIVWNPGYKPSDRIIKKYRHKVFSVFIVDPKTVLKNIRNKVVHCLKQKTLKTV